MFPARAGMNRSNAAAGTAERGVPRACGDEPNNLIDYIVDSECSPRVRG